MSGIEAKRPSPEVLAEARRIVDHLSEEYAEGPLPAEQPPMEMVEYDGTMLPVVRRCSISEEAYVQYELAITQAQLDSGALGDHDGERMRRSERALRSRYRGFVTGQVASL